MQLRKQSRPSSCSEFRGNHVYARGGREFFSNLIKKWVLPKAMFAISHEFRQLVWVSPANSDAKGMGTVMSLSVILNCYFYRYKSACNWGNFLQILSQRYHYYIFLKKLARLRTFFPAFLLRDNAHHETT